jgi:hypothetical protein
MQAVDLYLRILLIGAGLFALSYLTKFTGKHGETGIHNILLLSGIFGPVFMVFSALALLVITAAKLLS